MKNSIIIPLLLLIAITACKKEEAPSLPQAVSLPPQTMVINKPPVANAGSDQSIILPLNWARLDGSLSADPDGRISRYEWAIKAGPGISNMYNFDVDAKPSVTYAPNLLEGQYQFELTVTDNKGLTAKDIVQVTVLPDPFITNQALFRRFNGVPWAIGCDMRINNIASYFPAGAAIRIYVRSYNNLLGSSGWNEVTNVVTPNFFHYEITNNILILRAYFDCSFDFNEYDVLIRWN